MDVADDSSGARPGWERFANTEALVLIAAKRTIPVRMLHLSVERVADGHRFRPVHCVIPALATALTPAGELTIYDVQARRIVVAFIPLAIYALAGETSELHIDGRMITGLAG